MKKSKKYDYCNEVTHFTRGDDRYSLESGYQKFSKILAEENILGSNRNIQSGEEVVCFTESPFHCLKPNSQLNLESFKTYHPFGFQISKKTLYNKGGRPVIYSNHDEFELLHDDLKWSYSWQREWRLKSAGLQLIPNEIKLVLPNDEWIDRFKSDHTQQYHTPGCSTCPCQIELTIIKFKDYHQPAENVTLENQCPVPAKFKWLIINLEAGCEELNDYYKKKKEGS